MPKLLLLPGMDGTGDLFQGFACALPEGFNCTEVAYPRDEFVGYTGLVELVRAAAPQEDFLLVAESFSTPLAVKYAATLPSNLLGVVLCAGFCTSPARGWQRVVGLWAANGMFRWRLPKMAAEWWLLGADPPQALVRSLREAISRIEPEVMVARLRAVLNCDMRDEMAAVSVPILYMRASQDRLVHPECQKEMELIHPGHTVVVDGPHLLLQRKPALAAEVVVRFLRELTENRQEAEPA